MKLFWKTISFILMVWGMYYLTRMFFDYGWIKTAWALRLFFGFTLGVFPYKNYFRNE